MTRPFKRVLLVHPFGIGDFLFMTPVLRALRLQPGVERVDLLLGSRTESVVRKNPHVDDVFVIDKDRFHRQTFQQTLGELYRLGAVLRKRRYDLMIDYSMRDEYAFWARTLLGIPLVAGFAYKKRGFWLTHRVALPKGFSGKHASAFYSEVAEKIGVPVDGKWMEFYLDEKDRLEARQQLEIQGISGQAYLAISPGGGESWGKDAGFKRWPVEYYASLIEQLCRKTAALNVLLLGSAGEEKLCRELQNQLTVKAVNLAGKAHLIQAAALIEGARLFAGNDGGLVHVAHALRVPVIAFYGPVDPVVYGPVAPLISPSTVICKKDLECRPCYQNFRYRSDCLTRECLQQLSPQEAMDQIDQSGFWEKRIKNPIKSTL
ncbi:MAG: glycosyltransferase family 9 protein [Candidatus Omnitrophica bacterium]|nr:glycosyltransferase family 9 protein [Candidatus Omnitrophota bacterium]